ncbi:glycosyltransferase family 2 protein [Erysipelotrichaceae bacterium OH741_COT-311]|nr:glycosyltransferase family 2 protein [Erysipelotrichaceae bacterium OH741_COT-311]
MKPLVSVIIPAYNAEKTIERCIHSVINQTYQNIEVIVVDDGSIDNTFLLCEKYMELSNFIYHKQENQGVSSARNKGIKLSSGEYIAFVDSDDYIKEKMIEVYIHHLDKDLVCSSVLNSILHLKDKEKISQYNSLKDIDKDLYFLLINGFFTSPVCKLYKRKYIDTFFDIDISYGEDLLFNLKYFSNISSIIFIHEQLYFYDLSDSGLTKKLHEDEFETILKLSKSFLEFYKDKISNTKVINEKLYDFLANYFVVFFQKYCFKHKLWDLRLKPYLKNKEYQFILKNSTNSSLNMKVLKTNSALLIASFFKCKQLVKFVLARGKKI